MIRPSRVTELIFLVRMELVQTGRLMGRVALEWRKQAEVHDKDTLNTIVSRRTEPESRLFAHMKGGHRKKKICQVPLCNDSMDVSVD